MTFPPITFPPSTSTVSVKLLNAFDARFAAAPVFGPAPASHSDESAPFFATAWCFLVEHPKSGRKVVFDLGLGGREDLSELDPAMRDALESMDIIQVNEVAEQLVEGGVRLEDIDAVIWSHSHIDHIGSASKFPATTTLVVGPGTQADVRPAYPANPSAVHLESDFANREVKEITFDPHGLTVGGFAANDYFGDGSFYLLNTPGHCIGHMSSLARVTGGDTPSFILLAGDVAHHPGMLRPSTLAPLPASVTPSLPCVLVDIGAPAYDRPFLQLPADATTSIHHDHTVAQATIDAIQRFDAHPDVLVILAHDSSLRGLVDTFPADAVGWKEKGWKETGAWAFLNRDNAAFRWLVGGGQLLD